MQPAAQIQPTKWFCLTRGGSLSPACPSIGDSLGCGACSRSHSPWAWKCSLCSLLYSSVQLMGTLGAVVHEAQQHSRGGAAVGLSCWHSGGSLSPLQSVWLTLMNSDFELIKAGGLMIGGEIWFRLTVGWTLMNCYELMEVNVFELINATASSYDLMDPWAIMSWSQARTIVRRGTNGYGCVNAPICPQILFDYWWYDWLVLE